MAGFGLQEEEKISIFLRLVVVGEEAFLHVGRIFKMAGDLILLGKCQ